MRKTGFLLLLETLFMTESISTSKLRPPKRFVAEPFEYHQELELKIDTLTNLGIGLGRVDGWVVMVPLVWSK